MQTPQHLVITFSPDKWGQLERFQRFYSTTYSFSKHQRALIAGAGNHFYKATILFDLARCRRNLLEEDNRQLEEHGHTPAMRGKELSAILETVILELYASVDCSRAIVFHLYKNKRGIKNSTRKLFQNAFENRIDASVPLAIREAFATAGWYKEFLRMRDALVHADIGSCHLDKDGCIFYMHDQLGNGTRALVVGDIFGYVNVLFEHVNRFMGEIFGSLNSTLIDTEVWQMCGIFDGRIYSRYVRPAEAVDIHSGRCDAYTWFEAPGNPVCPLIVSCGAYRNRHKKPPGGA